MSPNYVAQFQSGLRSLLLPALCPIEEIAVGPRPWSDSTDKDLRHLGTQPRCKRCGMPVGPYSLVDSCTDCASQRFGFDRVICLGPYQSPLRELCLAIKRPSGAWLIPSLIAKVIECRKQDFSPTEDQAIILPIASSWLRQARRGFNQAQALAHELSRQTARPIFAHGLVRQKSTRRLSELSRQQRGRELRGAFRVSDTDRIHGKPILLVDDILTTGATCHAASIPLKKAGATSITVVVLARAQGVS